MTRFTRPFGAGGSRPTVKGVDRPESRRPGDSHPPRSSTPATALAGSTSSRDMAPARRSVTRSNSRRWPGNTSRRRCDGRPEILRNDLVQVDRRPYQGSRRRGGFHQSRLGSQSADPAADGRVRARTRRSQPSPKASTPSSWVRSRPSRTLRAGISAMGFGGINAHITLSPGAAPGKSRPRDRRASPDGHSSGDGGLCAGVEHRRGAAGTVARAGPDGGAIKPGRTD